MVFIVGMTIWILALVLLASTIALGHKLGAINAAFTFVGIIFGGLLATTLGRAFKHLLPHLGVHTETAVWALSPLLAFLVILLVFKVAGFYVHRRVEVYYKYQAGELRQALWLRLNACLGACIGTLNGTAYLVLISFLIFNFSYWSAQVAPGDNESRATKLVNRMGQDLDSTGMDKVGRALVTLPDNFYQAANLAGLVCQNPKLSERLGRYPAFISLMERDDLQQLAQNSDFTNAWNSQAPMGQLLNDPAFKAIEQNNDLVNLVWDTVQTNMDDLVGYLKTGKSAKYDLQPILGRWDFDVSVTVAMLRQARPNIPSNEMRAIRALWSQSFADTTFVAGGDGQAFLKNVPNFKNQPPTSETWKGSWTANGTNYSMSLDNNGENKTMTAQINGGRLTLKDAENTFIFDRED